jgi:hypothetical protein
MNAGVKSTAIELWKANVTKKAIIKKLGSQRLL